MKKLIVISSILAVFAASSALAKTEGNYVGVDIHRASLEARNIYRGSSGTTNNNTDFSSTKTGYGITYKYAINFDNKVFVAPGAFYETIGNKAVDYLDNPDHFTVKIRNRSGLKLDIGYDVSDTSAVYFTNGISRVSYQTSSLDADALNPGPAEKSRHKLGYFYGVGMSTNICKDVVVGFEYNRQNLTSKTIYTDTAKYDHRVKTQLDLFKINVAYHF